LKRQISAIVLALCLSIPVYADLPEEQSKKCEMEQELGNLEDSVDQINNNINLLNSEIDTLKTSIGELTPEILALEEELSEKEEQLSKVLEKYEEAIEQENDEQERIDAKIQYLHEIIGINNIEELSKTAGQLKEEVKLKEYQEIRKYVTDLKEQFEQEKEILAKKIDALMEEIDSMEGMIKEKELVIESYENELGKEQTRKENYKQKYEEQIAVVKEMQDEILNSLNIEMDSNNGSVIATYALQFIGNPYVLGGTSLTNGTDCSGFTQSVFKQFGISLPRTSGAQASAGITISDAEKQPGDIICYNGHVGIYIGNGQIVHASNPKTGIKIGPMYYRPIKCIKRYW